MDQRIETTEAVENQVTNQKQFEAAKLALQDPKEAVKQYLEDPKVISNLKMWQKFLEKKFDKKWFTVKDVLKNFNGTKDQVQQVLTVMGLQGSVTCRTYGIQPGGEKYKVCLSVKDKIEHLKLQLEYIDQQRALVAKEITTLEESLTTQKETK